MSYKLGDIIDDRQIKDSQKSNMDPNLEKDSLQAFEKLSHSNEYYNNVFKKTEKLVSVVFYIITNTRSNKKTESATSELSRTALETHQSALQSLRLHEHEAKTGLEPLTLNLIALEGALSIAHASGIVSSELLNLIVGEIDSVHRTIRNHFTKTDTPITFGLPPVSSPGTARSARPSKERARERRVPSNDLSSGAAGVYQSVPDRRERILTVLEATGEASIKDISSVITDCSEKTIQRELNSLIEEAKIKREGERRWSRYSIV